MAPQRFLVKMAPVAAGTASLRRLDPRLGAADHVPVSAAAFAGQMQAVARSDGWYARLGELAMPVLHITARAAKAPAS